MAKLSALRKQFPKQQAILDGVFGDAELQNIRDAQNDSVFESVDMDLPTEYCCPSCGYEWNGRPKPNAVKETKA